MDEGRGGYSENFNSNCILRLTHPQQTITIFNLRVERVRIPCLRQSNIIISDVGITETHHIGHHLILRNKIY